MNIKIYNKEDKIEVIVEVSAYTFSMDDLEKDVMDLYSHMERWTTLSDIEIGFAPIQELGECSEYQMPMVMIENENIKDGNLSRKHTKRNKIVDKWYLYRKIILSNKNPLRNIIRILSFLGLEINEKEKELIREVIKGEKKEIVII